MKSLSSSALSVVSSSSSSVGGDGELSKGSESSSSSSVVNLSFGSSLSYSTSSVLLPVVGFAFTAAIFGELKSSYESIRK
jgi:hypothetical protein